MAQGIGGTAERGLWLSDGAHRGDLATFVDHAMRLDDAQTILYTRGSVDFFRTYPGLYVPNPLVLHAQRRDTPDWNLLLKETLALTKMNWNTTVFANAEPITIGAARVVGDIMRHIGDADGLRVTPCNVQGLTRGLNAASNAACVG